MSPRPDIPTVTLTLPVYELEAIKDVLDALEGYPDTDTACAAERVDETLSLLTALEEHAYDLGI